MNINPLLIALLGVKIMVLRSIKPCLVRRLVRQWLLLFWVLVLEVHVVSHASYLIITMGVYEGKWQGTRAFSLGELLPYFNTMPKAQRKCS